MVKLKSRLNRLIDEGSFVAHFFVGDRFITTISSSGIDKFMMRLDGIDDVQKIVSTPDLLQRTRQHRTMCMLGFTPIFSNGLAYTQFVKDKWVTISFEKSRVSKITIAGEPVDKYSLNVDGVGGP
jgi:hypothetical protein